MVFKFTFWITSVAAAMAPVASIFILTWIDDIWGRLGTIAAFNVLVSVLLTLMTEARRTEVFSVTAAFAAVQVVFVGGALGTTIKTVYCKPLPS
ncbi:hypothetical protein BU23DRAFT_643310 [Bimuria novae-zelandiae CBS 107.79]|uniref:DUF6594 domain-containing protein n=1 Tax=Bimuria novae-zelandiae CBS 107.79 TaxID=1447943 RepID=A0A6A5V5C5_9PLEO|nr:hypothetical protein BU23DRAFT_643310 [Bimuria novae-zelandiae CBS 107.79]